MDERTLGALSAPGLLAGVLRRLPTPLLAVLDAWSHRIALRKAARRRRQATLR